MPPPQMTIMNAPSREYCVARRERTNTSLQALLLMNEAEYFKSAKACAAATLKESGGDARKGLRLLYEKVTSHELGKERLRLMTRTLSEFRALYESDKKLTESLTPEMKGSDIARRVDLAAWTMMAHSLFNLELTKVRR